MKKILADKTLETVLDAWVRQQPDLQLLVAGTNDELLSLHRAENVNVIISRLDAPGMQSERFLPRSGTTPRSGRFHLSSSAMT